MSAIDRISGVFDTSRPRFVKGALNSIACLLLTAVLCRQIARREPGFDLIKQYYRPYDGHEEFGRGFAAYQTGNFCNPHEADSISAWAWDHREEAAIATATVA